MSHAVFQMFLVIAFMASSFSTLAILKILFLEAEVFIKVTTKATGALQPLLSFCDSYHMV